MRPTRLLVLPVIATALVLSACGGDAPTTPSAEPAAASSTPATSEPVTPSTDEDDDDRDDRIDADLRSDLERIAVEHLGGGRVEEVEVSDDRDHRYEVEVDDVNGDDDVTVEISEDLEIVRVDR